MSNQLGWDIVVHTDCVEQLAVIRRERNRIFGYPVWLLEVWVFAQSVADDAWDRVRPIAFLRTPKASNFLQFLWMDQHRSFTWGCFCSDLALCLKEAAQ
jgi:hypothetical protein